MIRVRVGVRLVNLHAQLDNEVHTHVFTYTHVCKDGRKNFETEGKTRHDTTRHDGETNTSTQHNKQQPKRQKNDKLSFFQFCFRYFFKIFGEYVRALIS